MNKKLPSIIHAEQCLSEEFALKQFLQLGEKTPELADIIGVLENRELKFKEIFEIPKIFDKFDSFFNPLGWHAHDSVDLEIIKKAILLAQQDDFSSAERMLEEYYVENLNMFCTLLHGLPTYFEREHIIEKAKERFFAEDYISCVPLILMMADGFSSDMLNKGVFTEGAQLDAFDCLASNDDAFKEFISYIAKTRRKLSTDQLSMPYRNGIMHGLDVGYNNKLTAVKAWALLFTLREVLIRKKNERSDKSKFEAQQQKKTDEFYAYIKNPREYITNNIKMVDSFYNWSPQRTKEEWASILQSGDVSNCTPETPDGCLTSFLRAWQAGKYGIMAQLIHLPINTSVGKVAGDLRNALSNRQLANFTIKFIKETRGGIIFESKLYIEEEGKGNWEREIGFVACNYLENQKNFLSNKQGVWRLDDITISILCYLRRPDELTTIVADKVKS